MSNTCKHTHFCSQDHAVKKIAIVFTFIAIFLMIELWGHIKTKSLSLLADALHLLVDIAGFIISIITIKLSKRKPNIKMTFGYERAEVLGALFSVFFIWIAAVYLMVESIHKYLHPVEIDGKTFLEIAISGLVVNLICMFVLHHGQHKHEDEKESLNMRATYVHVIGDVIQSLGVILASAIIYYFKDAVIADLLCTIFFTIIILFTTFYVVRDSINILLESTPSEINLNSINDRIMKMHPSILAIIDIKCWALSVNKTCIQIKLLIDTNEIEEYELIKEMVSNYLENEINIKYLSISIDRIKKEKPYETYPNTIFIENK